MGLDLMTQTDSYNGGMSVQKPSPTQINNGVVDLGKGLTYDIFTIPTSYTFTAASNGAGSSTTKTIYIFNPDMNAAVTNNGSGASSIVNTYGDGFEGRVYNNLNRSAGGGRGVLIKGFTILSTNYTSGAQSATPFNTLQMQILCANGEGGVTPVPINVQEGLRNIQYQVGMLTLEKRFFLNGINQISCSLPADTIFAFTFITQAGSL